MRYRHSTAAWTKYGSAAPARTTSRTSTSTCRAHRLIVITGLSGSGKSSLAFDTLYAEGQRRYVESLSAYARQFLQLMEKPDVDLIEGLSPAISIEQKAASHNPRSTVGTVTEIHDYLRLLYARVGTPFCPEHDLPLQSQSVSQMVDATLGLPDDTKVMVLAPVVRDRKGEFVDFFEDMQTQGFIRFRVDGAVVEADDLPPLKKTEKHSVDVVVDRLKVRADAKQRLAESFETALRLADGRALLLDLDNGQETLFSSRFSCPVCSYSLSELEPRLFSFNNPMGACTACDGIGSVEYFDEKRVVAHPELSLAQRRDQGLGRAQPVLLPDAGRARAALRLRYRPAVRRTAGSGTPGDPVRLRATTRSRSRTRTSAAGRWCASMRSRAWCRTWNGASGKPIPSLCARN